ncbi:unnamed protein product [Enterobius vermicularis]|uniref:Ovule protein n=1 Tax=Enterobius vermicularis TaxID=51028 RepID=A0A0N4VFU1_ENTVE|nr:unnamed protein product [Enterobius vermicularis]
MGMRNFRGRLVVDHQQKVIEVIVGFQYISFTSCLFSKLVFFLPFAVKTAMLRVKLLFTSLRINLEPQTFWIIRLWFLY